MAVTRSDVAREAGVSPAVVSYVLNDGPRPASVQARARVLDAVRRLGYRPNAIASALRAGSTRTIGFLTPNRAIPFFGALAETVEQTLNDQGYLMLAANTHGYQPDEERLLRSFVDRRVDGLIISAGTSLVGSALDEVDAPVLVFEDTHESAAYSSVQTEDHLDASAAVDHLQNHGHDFIGCIVGPRQIRFEAMRLAGWRAQQHRNGGPAGEELVAFAEQSEAGGDFAARLLLSDHGRPATLHGRRPTALFVASDIQAIGVLWACHDLGIRVPEDVAVVSMGGTRAAAYAIPTLTTVRQDVQYLAGAACAQLLRLIADPAAPQTHLRVRGNLVVGQTCGCGQAAGEQVAQEPEPARAVLGRGDLQGEDLAVPVAVDPDRGQGMHPDDPGAFAAFNTSASAATTGYDTTSPDEFVHPPASRPRAGSTSRPRS